MPSLGKSIDLYLMDGTATGRWQATLVNRNCFVGGESNGQIMWLNEDGVKLKGL